MPSMELLYDHLERSTRHLMEGSARVARQRLLVEELRRDGHDTVDAELTLQILEDTLSAMRQHDEIIREQIATVSSLATWPAEAGGGSASVAPSASFWFHDPPSPQIGTSKRL